MKPDIAPSSSVKPELLTEPDHGEVCTTREAAKLLGVSLRTVQQWVEQGALRAYIEKPTLPYAVSMGINVLNRGCLDFIPKDRKFDIPELMTSMHQAGKPVYCHATDCYWQDIGRFEDYQQASADFANDPSRFLAGHP